MKIILNSVLKGERGEHVPETSLSYETGRVTLVAAETAQRPTVLALLASGRMLPDAGTVTVTADDAADSDSDSDSLARLRAATAIVDAPDVSEPVGDLTVKSIVQEELMFAGRPSNRRQAVDTLDELGAAEYAAWQVQNVPNTLRVRVLSELAASRPGIEALVLTSPDRRGGSPFEWFEIAADFARRGFAVLVIANSSSVDVLAETAARFDAERLADAAERAAAAHSAVTARLAELASEHPTWKTPAATTPTPTTPAATPPAAPQKERP